MPISNPYPLGVWDDDIKVDVNVPIAGINNSLPPSAIDQSSSPDAENRLAQIDALNRPRPGIIRLSQPNPTGGLDSIHHLGTGVFLANNAGSWYKYDNRSKVTSSLSGGPAYPLGSQVYSALADTVLYFSIGQNLDKYDPVSGTFGTVALPSQYPTALYPVWAFQRLIYVYQNNLIVSDVLDPETFYIITGSVTLDPITTDRITGQGVWQNQQLVVFRNGSTWVIETGPGLDVPDWSLNRISGTIGCRCHGTIVQTATDLFFLSETGRGIYALSQAPASNQIGIWQPLSQDIQGYINRINWAACDNARATYWRDLYLLALPLDGYDYNNFILVYSVSLQRWQGTWCFDVNNDDLAPRYFAFDATDPDYTMLLMATTDGIISRFTYPNEYQYYDQNIDGSRQVYDSRLVTKSFTFGEDVNQIRPHSVRMQFLESEDPVNVTILADRYIELTKRTVQTNNYLLTLPIAGFPFDLDTAGYKIAPIALLKTGLCTELQIELEGTGNWTLYQVKASAFESMPLVAR